MIDQDPIQFVDADQNFAKLCLNQGIYLLVCGGGASAIAVLFCTLSCCIGLPTERLANTSRRILVGAMVATGTTGIVYASKWIADGVTTLMDCPDTSFSHLRG